MITVLLITYNHQNNLKNSIKSVLNQKTNFDFKVKIIDYCSTDNSPKIIKNFQKEYPNKIETIIRKENVGYLENIYDAIANHVDTKYFCILEGDDEWCDENKLNLQFEALEKNPKCSFCCHDTKINNPDNNPRYGKNESLIFKDYAKCEIKKVYQISDLLNQKEIGDLWTHTSSRLYRYDLIDFKKLAFKESIVNDVCLFWYFLSKGDMVFISRVMSVYNCTGEGLNTSSNSKKSLDFLLNSLIKINIDLDFKFDSEIDKLLINHKFIDNITLNDLKNKAIADGKKNTYLRLLENTNFAEKPVIPILTCFDKNYITPGVVAFYSLLQNSDTNFFYKIYILSSDINLQDQYRMQYALSDFKNFSLEFIDMENKFDNLWNNLVTKGHFSKEVFYKLLSGSIFPNYDKIIVTDVDVVFTGDVSQSYQDVDTSQNFYLWSVKPVGKILNYYDNPQYKNNFNDEEISYLKASCGGYLIMNLNKIREDKIEEKFIESFQKDGHRLNQAEQDILNLVCANKIKFLHLKYLVCSYVYDFYKNDDDIGNDQNYDKNELIEALKNPVQIHYATSEKPWKNIKTSKAEIWYGYLAKTIYFQYFFNQNNNKMVDVVSKSLKISRKRKLHFKILKEKL